MKWINHMAIAGAVCAVWRPELVPVALLGSTAPDWLEFILNGIGIHTAHRTTTHYVSVWFAGVLFALFVYDWHGVALAFCAGGLSHLFADMLTIAGVPIGWWSTTNSNLFGGRLRTGQPGEYFVSAGVIIVCIGVAYLTRGYVIGGYTPFFTDWHGCYEKGLCNAQEWRTLLIFVFLQMHKILKIRNMV
jgi:inner membrane protein